MYKFILISFGLCEIFSKGVCVSEQVASDDEGLILLEENQLTRMSLATMEEKILTENDVSDASHIEFDAWRRCVYWTSSNNIRRKCVTGSDRDLQTLQIHTAYNEVRGLTFDWLQGDLYYVEKYGIYAISTAKELKLGQNSRQTLSFLPARRKASIQLPETIATSIAVHPQRGLLFWSHSKQYSSPGLFRVTVAGNDERRLSQTFAVGEDIRIAIDFGGDRLYWTDKSNQHIASCDFYGESYLWILEGSTFLRFPQAVAVWNDQIYWHDAERHSILKMDLIVNTDGYARIITSDDEANVTVLKTENRFYKDFCLDSKRMQCKNDSERPCFGVAAEGPENLFKLHCNESEFECSNQKCIAGFLRCDADDDCGDGSDEEECVPCPLNQFACESDGRCISIEKTCDGSIECADGSDELTCNSSSPLTSSLHSILNLTFDAESSILHWEQPDYISTDPVGYHVFVDTGTIGESPMHATFTTKLQSKMDLKECSKYAVSVSVWQSSEPPRPPTNCLRIRTKYNPHVPPKNARAFFGDTDALFTWEHTCDRKSEQPQFYLFRVHDLALNTTEEQQVSGLSYIFTGIYRGSEFDFSVASPEVHAVPFEWHHKAEPLPAPTALRVIPRGNWTFEFVWRPVIIQDETLEYELVVAKAVESNGNDPIVLELMVNPHSCIASFDQLAESIDAATTFIVGIRVRSEHGVRSAIVSTTKVQLQPARNNSTVSTESTENIPTATVSTILPPSTVEETTIPPSNTDLSTMETVFTVKSSHLSLIIFLTMAVILFNLIRIKATYNCPNISTGNSAN